MTYGVLVLVQCQTLPFPLDQFIAVLDLLFSSFADVFAGLDWSGFDPVKLKAHVAPCLKAAALLMHIKLGKKKKN